MVTNVAGQFNNFKDLYLENKINRKQHIEERKILSENIGIWKYIMIFFLPINITVEMKIYNSTVMYLSAPFIGQSGINLQIVLNDTTYSNI